MVRYLKYVFLILQLVGRSSTLLLLSVCVSPVPVRLLALLFRRLCLCLVCVMGSGHSIIVVVSPGQFVLRSYTHAFAVAYLFFIQFIRASAALLLATDLPACWVEFILFLFHFAKLNVVCVIHLFFSMSCLGFPFFECFGLNDPTHVSS